MDMKKEAGLPSTARPMEVYEWKGPCWLEEKHQKMNRHWWMTSKIMVKHVYWFRKKINTIG
jgi:hypothetical protein